MLDDEPTDIITHAVGVPPGPGQEMPHPIGKSRPRSSNNPQPSGCVYAMASGHRKIIKSRHNPR